MVITNGICWNEYAICRDSADSGDYIFRKLGKTKQSKTTKAKKKTMVVNKTFESSKKQKRKCSFNIQQDNTKEIDEANDNAESIAEKMLLTSEKVQCPIDQ